MLSQIIHKFQYGKHIVTLKTGMMARQSTAAIMASMDDTSVFISVVANKQTKSDQNFFPLIVNYQERTYAVGRFPGGFFRREGRPNENEILVSRLIDRSSRPLFHKNFFNEVQIIATVVSVNPQINPDIVAIIGSSAALSISGIPFNGPIGAARIGYINNQYILNPTKDELTQSNLNLIVSGTKNAILMVESESNLLNEDQVFNAIMYGYKQQQLVIDNIIKLTNKINNEKWKCPDDNIIDNKLHLSISELAEERLKEAYIIPNKVDRHLALESIRSEVLEVISNLNENIDKYEIKNILNLIERKIVRNRILHDKIRIDGRKINEIRNLDVQVGILPRTHGSALFTRGETQALVTVTLGTERDAQNVDELIGEKIDRFILHYNFPPYCVGEVGIIGSPKRREIGHGCLAKKGVIAVMPSIDDFPYTVRVVSEIIESNGSSSMASVCGASLALMDAGVPIKSAVAGVSMGLVKEQNKFVILHDILSDEDYLGDMDFKVSGSRDGITSLQMDIKIEGITSEIIKLTLEEARNARLYILEAMNKVISSPRRNISEFAPKIVTMKINPNKIRDVIGKGGSVIKSLTESTNTIIEIEDNGIIKIISTDINKTKHAIHKIEEITKEIKIGGTYIGKVTRIVNFGAFISFKHLNKEGLVHISQISNKRINNINDCLKLGQEVLVKVLEIDHYGRIKLSMKEANVINEYSKK